jgi:hypothetical protein
MKVSKGELLDGLQPWKVKEIKSTKIFVADNKARDGSIPRMW